MTSNGRLKARTDSGRYLKSPLEVSLSATEEILDDFNLKKIKEVTLSNECTINVRLV